MKAQRRLHYVYLVKISLISTILGIALLAGCAQQQTPRPTPTTVNIEDLFRDPVQYNNTQLCTEGVLAAGTNLTALGLAVDQQGGATFFDQPLIWIDTKDFTTTGDCYTVDGFPDTEFCPVRVCGLFQSGGTYGYMGQYDYQISAPAQQTGGGS